MGIAGTRKRHTTMRRTWPILLPAVALTLVGAWASYMLMAKHLTKSSGAEWFDNVCEGAEESAVSCDEVLASKYGLFPPVPLDVDPELKYEPRVVIGSVTMRPRPVALFGLMYFIALAGWYIFIGRPDYSRRALHLLPLLLTLCGACGSLFFAYVMFFTDLEAWCPWCMVTHVVNWLLLVCAVLLWPRKPLSLPPPTPRPEQEPEPAFEDTTVLKPGEARDVEGTARLELSARRVREEAVAPKPTRAYPSFRLAAVTLAGIVAAMSAEWFFHDYVATASRYAALDQAMNEVRGHAATLYAMYLAGEKHTFPRREGDGIWGGCPEGVCPSIRAAHTRGTGF